MCAHAYPQYSKYPSPCRYPQRSEVSCHPEARITGNCKTPKAGARLSATVVLTAEPFLLPHIVLLSTISTSGIFSPCKTESIIRVTPHFLSLYCFISIILTILHR